MSVNGIFWFDFLDSLEVSCCTDYFLCDQTNFGFGRLPFATLELIASVSLLNEKTCLTISLLMTSFVATRFGSPPIEKTFGRRNYRLREGNSLLGIQLFRFVVFNIKADGVHFSENRIEIA